MCEYYNNPVQRILVFQMFSHFLTTIVNFNWSDFAIFSINVNIHIVLDSEDTIMNKILTQHLASLSLQLSRESVNIHYWTPTVFQALF